MNSNRIFVVLLFAQMLLVLGDTVFLSKSSSRYSAHKNIRHIRTTSTSTSSSHEQQNWQVSMTKSRQQREDTNDMVEGNHMQGSLKTDIEDEDVGDSDGRGTTVGGGENVAENGNANITPIESGGSGMEGGSDQQQTGGGLDADPVFSGDNPPECGSEEWQYDNCSKIQLECRRRCKCTIAVAGACEFYDASACRNRCGDKFDTCTNGINGPISCPEAMTNCDECSKNNNDFISGGHKAAIRNWSIFALSSFFGAMTLL